MQVALANGTLATFSAHDTPPHLWRALQVRHSYNANAESSKCMHICTPASELQASCRWQGL